MSDILIDCDGVLADFMGRVYQITEQETGHSYCHADTKDYWFNDSPDKDLFLDIMNRPGIYADLDVITGAVRAVNRLRERFDVQICSAPPKLSTTAEDEKREWLAKHFDKDFAESALITRDKHLAIGRILIEDNPDVVGVRARWRPVIFDQPWNQNARAPRMFGWGDLSVVYALL